MRESKLALDLDDLGVDSFSTTDPDGMTFNPLYASYVQRTVLYHTEQVSCGGSCNTCPCYA